MASFSERMGYEPVRKTLQLESMNDALRTSLWNVLVHCLWKRIAPKEQVEYDKDARLLTLIMWQDYFKRPTHELPWMWEQVMLNVYDYFSQCQWYEVYDFIEFVTCKIMFPAGIPVIPEFNEVLERELSAYRFVGTLIAPITSDEEIAAIEKAAATAEASKPLHPIAIHLRQAVASLADRQAPDFRNSMKESISAVEALCKLITGDDKATLGVALRKIEVKRIVPLHPALKSAFQSLYTYTSDAGGIRHALKGEPADVELEDATFMLVTCSAFVNYLVEKARKAGITL